MEQHARDAINNEHENKPFLPGCPLAESVKAFATVEEAFENTEVS